MTRRPATLRHRGLIGTVDASVRDGLLHGEIQGLRKAIRYSGTTVEETRQAFIAAVNRHLDQAPGTPRACSGHVNVRINPDVHRLAVARAAEAGMSLAAWTELALQAYCAPGHRPTTAAAKKR